MRMAEVETPAKGSDAGVGVAHALTAARRDTFRVVCGVATAAGLGTRAGTTSTNARKVDDKY